MKVNPIKKYTGAKYPTLITAGLLAATLSGCNVAIAGDMAVPETDFTEEIISTTPSEDAFIDGNMVVPAPFTDDEEISSLAGDIAISDVGETTTPADFITSLEDVTEIALAGEIIVFTEDPYLDGDIVMPAESEVTTAELVQTPGIALVEE